MATVSLQTVFDEARRAIETGAADKAIGIAQHILVHFPRMIEGSRLLGEAYLNAGQPEHAAAAFEQVLRADPENVAAYYGLGLAQQSLDQRSSAITAFERALEIQPNLSDLRTQLMRLYAEAPGGNGQFRLSRAGLGRLYARGGMFGQAVDEFRAVLDNEPDRDDVQVALAEALWRDGQEDEATDFCRDVLERRTELLKPTLLLGYMLFAAGQPEGETLWRRAASQDGSMTMAGSLFDILPPIRIEEPILPQFDEAEWRAQQAQQAVAVPVPAAVTVNSSDDDFFAGSWLSETGTSTPSTSARTYDTLDPANAPAHADNGDDDLLASLLGFSEVASIESPSHNLDDANVQPFALDDWNLHDNGTSQNQQAQLPASLDDIALPDPTPTAHTNDVHGVQPFSFDDWALDDEPAAAQVPTPQSEPELPDIKAFSWENDDVGTSVKPFSFDDDSTTSQAKPFTLDDDTPTSEVKPFSFDANSAVDDVQPFSLDDEPDFGSEPFAFDSGEHTPTPASPQTPSASLGAVQPFSLDDWGMDDADSPNGLLTSDQAQNRDGAANEFGDFKPFSLDELSLDALDVESPEALSGPSFATDDQDVDKAGFSWEEPTWRSQSHESASGPNSEGDSIFAKLMRNRPAEQPSAASLTSDDTSFDDDSADFFSVDDEPLRVDAQTSGAESATLEPHDPEAVDIDQLGIAATTNTNTALPEPSQVFNLDDLDIFGGTTTSDHISTTSAASAEQPVDNEGDDFSFDPLEVDVPTFALDDTRAATLSSNSDTTLPFSLSELGLSDDALELLDDQPEIADDVVDQGISSQTSPFSFDEFDLDNSLLALDQSDSSAQNIITDGDASSSMSEFDLNDVDLEQFDSIRASAAVTNNAEQIPSMTPFSLSELGLNDDEIAALSLDDTP